VLRHPAVSGNLDSMLNPAGAEQQLDAIESVTDVTVQHLDVDDLLSNLLRRVAALLGVDTVAVLLLDNDSQQLVARAAWGIEEEVRQGVKLTVGHGFAGRIAATRQPVVLDRVDSTTVANPLLWEKGIRTMLGVPLLSGDELLGVLHVGSLSERHFTDADYNLLAQVATRMATAVHTRQLEVDRAAARVLQRSLLPSVLPQLPDIEFSTRYVAAEVGGVGGDWYDAFVLSDGTLWVMVGDVVGHGLHAATVMGRLRSTLQSYALDSHSPEEVLARADRKLGFFEPLQSATILCASLSPPYESMRLSLAGHPPPVLAAPDIPAVLVSVSPDLPLGVDLSLPRTATTVPLPVNAVVVAYTDGLIERRGKSLDEGFGRLCQAVRPQGPEQICHDVMDALVGREPPQDDIALLTFRRRQI
jgi:sigma-B regulation protein RsbU (phosphoserine phosphatase)